MLLIAENCVPGQEPPFIAFSFILFQRFMYVLYVFQRFQYGGAQYPPKTCNITHWTQQRKREKLLQSYEYATEHKIIRNVLVVLRCREKFPFSPGREQPQEQHRSGCCAQGCLELSNTRDSNICSATRAGQALLPLLLQQTLLVQRNEGECEDSAKLWIIWVV